MLLGKGVVGKGGVVEDGVGVVWEVLVADDGVALEVGVVGMIVRLVLGIIEVLAGDVGVEVGVRVETFVLSAVEGFRKDVVEVAGDGPRNGTVARVLGATMKMVDGVVELEVGVGVLCVGAEG